MCAAVTKSDIESAEEQHPGELYPIDITTSENVPLVVPIIQVCSMCHSIWDYYSEMTECPKCGTRFNL
jgi:hypothetical protein